MKRQKYAMKNDRVSNSRGRGRRPRRRRGPHAVQAMAALVVAAAARIQCAAAWCCPPAAPPLAATLRNPALPQSFVARQNGAPLSASTAPDVDLSSSSTTSASSDAAVALSDPAAASASDPASSTPSADTQLPLEPKQIVKLFGRLADKYLLLDPSGGNCCFSGCTGCEYRLEGGGYRMADSTSSRPKWIPTYATRINAAGHPVTSGWSRQLFAVEDDMTPSNDAATTKSTKKTTGLDYDAFRSLVVQMEYEPPLGGPNLPKSASELVDDEAAIRRLWTLLLGPEKKKKKKDDDKERDARLTLRKVQKQWQRIASATGSSSSSDDNNAGITWKQFLAAMQSDEPL
jgi:hypothetical protein